MANPPSDPGDPFSTSLPKTLRDVASECSDPEQRDSLSRRADELERTEARLNTLASSSNDALKNFRSEVEARRRHRELPAWFVVLVLLAFAAFLGLVALKHHV